jgi:hypothetical protein
MRSTTSRPNWWRTARGGYVRVRNMDDAHVVNALRLLRLHEHEAPWPHPLREAWIERLEEEAELRGLFPCLPTKKAVRTLPSAS